MHKILKNMKKSFYYILAIGFVMFLTSCSSDNDDTITSVPGTPVATTPPSGTNTSTTGTGTSTTATATNEINDFIWKGLNLYYYWQEQVPNLADSKKTNAADYLSFLSNESNPTSFFNSLKFPVDRFSWIQNDYKALENQLAGISSDNGMRYIVTRQCDGCNNLVLSVTHVVKGSDAEKKGIKRGDFVNRINNINLNTNNYIALLTSQDLSYNVGRASFDSSSKTFTNTGTTITLNKIKDFQEDPIHRNLVLNHGGKKVGYLMYNSFNSSFDEQLIKVFSEFSTQGVTELVLDLRYNPGGSVQTCTYLASLITGQFTGQVFAKQIWNSKLTAFFEGLNNNSNTADDRELNNYFVNKTVAGTTLTSLKLGTVYILATNKSASASELLINGLSSYINVVVIGSRTVGKNVGSVTLYDYIDNKNPATKNPNHTYAMQPIVLKIANSKDFADYADGLIPTLEQQEVASNYGVLGSPTEPLLATALSKISGTARRFSAPKPDGLVQLPPTEESFGMYIEGDFSTEMFSEILFKN